MQKLGGARLDEISAGIRELYRVTRRFDPKTIAKMKKQINPVIKAHFIRTVNPRAQTLAVQILSISNVPSDVLDALDELAAEQGRSRSSFVRRELQRIVAEYRGKAA
jgi:hypothetical protein